MKKEIDHKKLFIGAAIAGGSSMLYSVMFKFFSGSTVFDVYAYPATLFNGFFASIDSLLFIPPSIFLVLFWAGIGFVIMELIYKKKRKK